jgi:hypothetical protein
MTRLVLTILVALLFFAWPSLAEEKLKLDFDPETKNYQIGGWSRSTSASETIHYVCERQECGPGTHVSVVVQPGSIGLQEFLAGQDRWNEQVKKALGDDIIRIDSSEPESKENEKVSVTEISKTLVLRPGAPASIKPHWISAFVKVANHQATVAVSADSKEAAYAACGIHLVPVTLGLFARSSEPD